MGLEEVVNVSISAATATVSRKGFGTPLLAAYHTKYLDRVRSYASLPEMVADGFLATEPIYRAAAKAFGQDPRPAKIKIGRRALVHTQKFRLTPTITTTGHVYKFEIVRFNGTVATVQHTVTGGQTVETIIDSLVTAIGALSPALGMATTDNTTNLELTASTPGQLFDYRPINAGITFKDVTTDPGIATDLAAIRQADDDWYGLALDSNSEAEGLATCAWAEANEKLFAGNTADSEALDSGVTNDYASDGHAAAYARSFVLWSATSLSYAGLAWLGKQLPTDPGTATWAFKTLAGVTVDKLTSTQMSTLAGDGKTLHGKGGNHYTQLAGRNITRWGKTFADEYIDITVYIDFLKARIQENVFAVLINNPKIPYTDSGIEMIKAPIKALLRQGVESGALAADPAPYVTAPLVADIDPADRAARHLPDVEFQARLAGAIHKIDIKGRLSP